MQDFDRTGLGAFFSNPDLKAFYVKRMEAHVEADEVIRGEGWDGHRGCAVGCTLNAYSYAQYLIQLNLPQWLAQLEDEMHENISDDWGTPFALQFLRAIPVGADVEPVRHHLGVFIMDRNLERVKSLDIDPKLKASVFNTIAEVRNLHSEALSGVVSKQRWSSAESAARSAEWAAAWSAAESAFTAEYDAIAHELIRLLKKAKPA